MNTVGPAFPGTLLDWFAGQALTGILADSESQGEPEEFAAAAYNIAEFMLAEKARREAVVQESSTTDHSPDTGKMIPDPFAEDALRQLASDVLPADIKDAASEERLTWCAEQVRAQVNTLEARNRELVQALSAMEMWVPTHCENQAVAAARAVLEKAKEAKP